ncbi:VPA1269 family protein [Paraburkholderia youngii]|uniref:VPA1269 family protein n=1 Tax=Paraburkholderia youngii TaxID=2782701 RepID=UPI003D228744
MLQSQLSSSSVTLDCSGLSSAIGFWSQAPVYFNMTEHVVVLDSSLNFNDFTRFATDLGSNCLKAFINDFSTRLLHEYDVRQSTDRDGTLPEVWKELTLRSEFLTRTGLDISWSDRGRTWWLLAEHAIKSAPFSLHDQIKILSDIVLDGFNACELHPNFSKGEYSPIFLTLPYFLDFIENISSLGIEKALRCLVKVSRITILGNRFRQKVGTTPDDAEAVSLLETVGVAPDRANPKRYFFRVLRIARAAEMLLGNLALNGSILLPCSMVPSEKAAALLDPVFRSSSFDSASLHLVRFLTFTSTVRTPADVPEELFEHTRYLRARGITRSLLLYRPAIEAFHRSNPSLPLWPLSRLYGSNLDLTRSSDRKTALESGVSTYSNQERSVSESPSTITRSVSDDAIQHSTVYIPSQTEAAADPTADSSIVTRKLSALRRSIGYWSRSDVFFNACERLVILDDTLDTCHLLRITDTLREDALNKHCEYLSAEFVENNKVLKNDKRNSVFCNFFSDFTIHPKFLKQFETNISFYDRIELWAHLAEVTTRVASTDINKQAKFLSGLVLSGIRENSLSFNCRKTNHTYSHLLLHSSEFKQFIQYISEKRIEDALHHLSILKRFKFRYQLSIPREKTASDNIEIIDLLERAGIMPIQALGEISFCGIRRIAKSAEILLGALALNRSILLPGSMVPCSAAAASLDPVFGDSRFDGASLRLMRFLTFTSTIRSPFEFPESAYEQTRYLEMFGVTRSLGLYQASIESLQQSNETLPNWPLSGLYRDGVLPTGMAIQANEASSCRPLVVTDENTATFQSCIAPAVTPPVRNALSQLGDQWIRFAEILERSNDAGDQHVSAALRDILNWARRRSFLSPAVVTSTEIIDPSKPFRGDTFFSFLRTRVETIQISEGTAWKYWLAAARGFSLVKRALMISPDPVLALESNPFDGILNPFKSGMNGSKSPRPRLPNSILECMLEILLDRDENYTPTYRWAKSRFPEDVFYKPTAHGPVEVWCPSRPRILALLLVLPLRPKQARWLDRGLMDEWVWDFSSNKYLTNKHALKDWAYPDGRSHLTRYGRASGVLQPLRDGMFGNEDPCIFVSTNKTQLWSPGERKGYEIPWPFLTESEARNAGLENGRWLQLPYELIRAQTEWINEHYPNPVPVSFADSAPEASQVNAKYIDSLPSFTPLFTDLSVNGDGDDSSSDPAGKGDADDNSRGDYYLPVSHAKIVKLFDALVGEAEDRLASEGRHISLTQVKGGHRVSLYDLYSLRIAGISRLIEMGIPIHIVQEFIAGHATAVMTAHYNRPTSASVSETIVEKIAAGKAVHGWDKDRASLASQPIKWVFNRRYARYRSDDLLQEFWGWKIVPGGICPVGGTACHIGIPNVDDSEMRRKPRFSAVTGGCGNCRFFSTGPAFLIQQAQAMNEIMLELRGLGRARNGLRDVIDELSWQDTPSLTESGRKQLSLRMELAKEQISVNNKKCEELILEWSNRYKMFVDSEAIAASAPENSDTEEDQFVLLTGAEVEDIRKQVEIRLETRGDFSLVKNILDSAVIMGGIERCSVVARDSCVRFMDLVLRTEGSSYLLIDIPDDQLRHKTAYRLASLVERIAGTKGVEDSLDNASRLSLSDRDRKDFLSWVEQVFAETMVRRPAGVLSDANVLDR